MSTLPKVAIVYLSYHSEPYLGDVVSALKKISYPKDRTALIIVDNPHPEHGSSVRYIEETVMPLSGTELPEVVLLPQKTNLGFSGGNNVGIRYALEHGFDYVYLHNNDGFVAANFLEPLVKVMEDDAKVGAVQSLIMLYPDTDLVNTAGNCYHYLGLGYCGDFRRHKSTLQLPPVKSINYASGAGMLMRASLLKKHGLWDEDYFLYHEDIEYSYRLKSLGYTIALASESIFFHKYQFGRNAEKFFYIERNRVGLLLSLYKIPTLILLLPMLIILDLGLILFSLKSGWFVPKLRAYAYWLNPAHWNMWLKKRASIQSARTVGDRTLLSDAVGAVNFDDGSINNPLLRYIGNPLMSAYWVVVKHLLFW
jgi:GT2 family glycosyltransferase